VTRRSWIAALAALTLFATLSGGSIGASPARIESKHFVIAYDSGTSFAYVEIVQRGLEAAYDLFVKQASFTTFSAPVEVRITVDGDGSMGAEYLETDAAGAPAPVIEIAPERSMAASASASAVGLSLEDAILSTTAHEFFHVLQDFASLQGQGDASEPAFIEPLATAVQEVAAPYADDYAEAAIDFLLAPDAVSFFQRGYDGGLFWAFVLDRYGGLETIRRVMAASARADGARAVDQAFAGDGLTFLDLWAKFVTALATGTLPDGAALAKLSHVWSSDLGVAELWFPPPIAVARWTGSADTMDRVTEESPAEAILGYSDSALGAPLQVSHAYGIDVIAIRPESGTPLAIRVVAATATDFRIAFVGRRGTQWDLLSFAGRDLVVQNPTRFNEIRVVVTRGETGSGAYTVRLSAAP
jgi:hypothetical protein